MTSHHITICSKSLILTSIKILEDIVRQTKIEQAANAVGLLILSVGRAMRSALIIVISLSTGLLKSQDYLRYTMHNPSTITQSDALHGSRVAAGNAYTAVSALYEDGAANDVGTVRIYEAASGDFVRVLNNPNQAPASFSAFGGSLAITGSILVVGSYGDATTGGVVYVYDLSSLTPDVPIHTIPNPSPEFGDTFGASVAISGTRIVVGASHDDGNGFDSGSAYVFDLATATPTVPITTLLKPSPAVADKFGCAVSISGTRVVVGASLADIGSADTGVAYIYNLTGATPGTAVLTLTNPTPASLDRFGESVSISGSYAVISASEDDSGSTDAGSVYVFNHTTGALFATVNNPDPSSTGYFGSSVSLFGNRLLVGASGNDTGATNAGVAFVFDMAAATPFIPVAAILNPSPGSGDEFGSAVSVNSTRIVIGAPYDDGGGGAYFFAMATGQSPNLVSTLMSTSISSWDQFGTSVGMFGNWVVVGAPEDDSSASNSGVVYVFDKNSSNPSGLLYTLANPSPAEGDRFGQAVAVSGARIIVSAPYDDTGATDSGSVYVFDLASVSPTVPTSTIANPSPAANDNFGNAVAISGRRLLIGACLDDASASNSGRAYYFDVTDTAAPSLVATMTNPSPFSNDQFGFSVAISGTNAVVGAPLDNSGATDSGLVHVYDLASVTPGTVIRTLTNPSPASSDLFGNSVAVSGSRFVVGATGDDNGASNAGIAYAYDLTSPTPNTPTHTLPNDQPAISDNFGSAVAISGRRIAIAAKLDNLAATDSGTVFLYDLATSTPTVPVAFLTHPDPQALDSFGTSLSIDGGMLAIGTPLDDTPILNRGSCHVFELPITSTDPPSLISPISNSTTSNPISVSFSLPTRAAAGSVKLLFDSHELILAASQETAGVHSFSLDTAAPLSSPEIANGEPIPEGLYLLAVSYKASTLAPPAQSEPATNFRIDRTGPGGGAMMLLPTPTIPISTPLTVSFSNWSDPSSPMTYRVYIDGILIGDQNASATRIFTGPSTVGTHTLQGRIYDSVNNYTEVLQNFTVHTSQEIWRFQHFGTIANSGDAADDANPDHDGLSNILEFATGGHPHSTNPGPVLSGPPVEGMIEFLYTRSNAALSSFDFIVEWSDTLQAPWSTMGVTQTILSENGSTQSMKALLPTGSIGRRFVRLRLAPVIP